ncbi:MAG: hypothetical protein ACYC6C_08005 [Coriobacteriia bacterium]
MPSGGARARSGPAPDPNALRRDRKNDAEWTTLPAGGFDGVIPGFPLAGASAPEIELWEILWRKPQAAMWAKLDLTYEVAAYVRAFLESVEPKAVNGLKTAVLRMAAEIGLSLPGMHSLRWKFAENEVAAKRSARPVAVPRNALDDVLDALA